MIRALLAAFAFVLIAAAVAGAGRTSGGPPPRPQKPTGDKLAAAARAWLASLGPQQVAAATFPFNSDERLNWFYVPRERKGLTIRAMTSDQQKLALELLHAGLSQKGFTKVQTIRSLENVLKAIEQGKGPHRDPEMYYFTVFGEPAAAGTWGWRFEGHHVSLNWTLVNGRALAATPQFLGSNPADVKDGPMKGTRVLGAEEDLGRALVTSLSPEQRKLAVISEKAPADILTNNQRIAAIQDDAGIAYGQLTKEQQGMLLALVREHASAQTSEIARKRLDAVRKAGLDKLKFAWMGSLTRYQGHYYRVQGPAFLIEYDNTQNDANHIHAVWREFKGDWGQDLLAAHYRSFPHGGRVAHRHP